MATPDINMSYSELFVTEETPVIVGRPKVKVETSVANKSFLNQNDTVDANGNVVKRCTAHESAKR